MVFFSNVECPDSEMFRARSFLVAVQYGPCVEPGKDVSHYVLTHFHSDHTVGLTRNFDCGTIYCTETWWHGGIDVCLCRLCVRVGSGQQVRLVRLVSCT